LENSISKNFKLFTTINKKIIVESSSRKRASKQVNILVKQRSVGDKISEQNLITKAPGRTQERLGLKCESKIWQSSACTRRKKKGFDCKILLIG